VKLLFTFDEVQVLVSLSEMSWWWWWECLVLVVVVSRVISWKETFVSVMVSGTETQ